MRRIVYPSIPDNISFLRLFSPRKLLEQFRCILEIAFWLPSIFLVSVSLPFDEITEPFSSFLFFQNFFYFIFWISFHFNCLWRVRLSLRCECWIVMFVQDYLVEYWMYSSP